MGEGWGGGGGGVGVGGDLCFQDGKSWISTLHCTIFFLLSRVSVYFTFDNKECMTSRMNKFHFLRSPLQNKRS